MTFETHTECRCLIGLDKMQGGNNLKRKKKKNNYCFCLPQAKEDTLIINYKKKVLWLKGNQD